jgi:hypothetical protein
VEGVRKLLHSLSHLSAVLAVFLTCQPYVRSQGIFVSLESKASHSPTTSQSGQTIRHLRFRLSDNASHMGTLHAEGGWKGPYIPYYFSLALVSDLKRQTYAEKSDPRHGE